MSSVKNLRTGLSVTLADFQQTSCAQAFRVLGLVNPTTAMCLIGVEGRAPQRKGANPRKRGGSWSEKKNRYFTKKQYYSRGKDGETEVGGHYVVFAMKQAQDEWRMGRVWLYPEL